MTSKKKKKLLDILTKELESPAARNGEAKMMAEYAMFVRSVQLDEARKISYIQ